jgi:hypothetical protein
VRPAGAGDEIEATFTFVLHVCPGPFRVGIGVAEAAGNLPVAVGGAEPLAFEVISDRPAFGLANLEAEIEIAYASK